MFLSRHTITRTFCDAPYVKVITEAEPFISHWWRGAQPEVTDVGAGDDADEYVVATVCSVISPSGSNQP